ncbi:MAG: hypothetical protein IRZ21_00395 [Thermoleophilaceae bacterium]|nr:hypothetical protein [Thermoleophilaceae bacterium]
MRTEPHAPPTRADVGPERPRGEGWVMFAIVYLGIVGVLNIIYGIAALENKQYFNEGDLLWSSLRTWGWVAIVLGACQILVAGLIRARTVLGAMLGITLASFAFIASFLAIGAYPVWSVIAMVMEAFVIWALAVNIVDRAY